MVMAQPVQHWQLGIGPLTCHAWNKDRTQVAVSPSNNEVHILEWTAGKWQQVHKLTEHDLPVTSLDWAPNTNRIVTCSQDKNAFVWTYDKASNQWKPELVMARLDRAATCVRWSPLENKFAVGCGSKLVSICHYEKGNDWWVAKHIKKPIRSTVTSLDWHPNNMLLAVGACDYRTRVYSAYVKEVDTAPPPTPWGNKCKMGELVLDVSNGGGGWVHAVRFSPSGNRLVWVGHDSSLSVVDVADTDAYTTVKEWFLPFTTVEWVSENALVAAGHDCCPMLFSYKGVNQLTFVSKLDVPSNEQKTNKTSAMNKFKSLDKVASSDVDVSIKTLHQNRITGVCAHTGPRTNVSKFSTIAIDGQLALWDLRSLEQQIQNIRIS